MKACVWVALATWALGVSAMEFRGILNRMQTQSAVVEVKEDHDRIVVFSPEDDLPDLVPDTSDDEADEPGTPRPY